MYIDKEYIDKSYDINMSVPVHVYSHHALAMAVRQGQDQDLTGIAEIERALADYLSASFLQSPVVAALHDATLENASIYSSSTDEQRRGLVQLVVPAWEAAANSQNPRLKLFSDKIKAAPAPIGTCFANEIKRRRLPQ